jgi:hypothetical protein
VRENDALPPSSSVPYSSNSRSSVVRGGLHVEERSIRKQNTPELQKTSNICFAMGRLVDTVTRSLRRNNGRISDEELRRVQEENVIDVYVSEAFLGYVRDDGKGNPTLVSSLRGRCCADWVARRRKKTHGAWSCIQPPLTLCTLAVTHQPSQRR